MIPWTKQARAWVHVRRPSTDKPIVVDRKKTFERVEKLWRKRRDTTKWYEPKWDLEASGPKAAEAARCLEERLVSDDVEVAAISAHLITPSAYFVRFRPNTTRTYEPSTGVLVDLWVRERGVVFALRALAATWRFMTYIDERQHVTAPTTEGERRAALGDWRRLRAHLAQCPEDAWREARDAASALREEPHVDLATAYAFPSEAEWARDALKTKTTDGELVTMLAAMASTASDAKAVIGPLWSADAGATVVDAIGHDAAPILVAALDEPALVGEEQLEVVSLLHTPLVARWFVKMIAHDELEPWQRRAVQKTAMKYFDALEPKVALDVLGKAKASGRAAEVLAMFTKRVDARKSRTR